MPDDLTPAEIPAETQAELLAQARTITPDHLLRAVRYYRAHEAELRRLRLLISPLIPVRSEACHQWYTTYDALSRANALLTGIQMGVASVPATFIAHVVEMVATATTLRAQLTGEQYDQLMAAWRAGFTVASRQQPVASSPKPPLPLDL